jgi:hypothetical protein
METYEGVCRETASTFNTVWAIFILFLVDLFCDLLDIVVKLFYEPGTFLVELGVIDCTGFAFLAGLIRSDSARVWVFNNFLLLL